MWIQSYFKLKIFCCLEQLRPSPVYTLVTGCNCSISLVTATMNTHQLFCNCCSLRKMSAHSEGTEMRADWQPKGRWVGEVPATDFLPILLNLSCCLHHIKFSSKSVPMNFMPFTVTSVSSHQPDMTESESCLTILALTIYYTLVKDLLVGVLPLVRW